MDKPRVHIAKKLASVRGRDARLKEAGEKMARGLGKAASNGQYRKAKDSGRHASKKAAA